MSTAITTTQVGASYVSLGAGPLSLQATEGAVYVEIADSSPAATAAGFALRPEYGRLLFQTASTLWARAAVASGNATIISAPSGSTVITNAILTEGGDIVVTEAGDTMITET
jgi:hypothetical protein